MNDHLIIGSNLSETWARAFLKVAGTPQRELAPLVVTITTPFGVQERGDIRRFIDQALANAGESSVDTVAGTIFPSSLWNRTRPRSALFDRYERIWPRIKKVPQNRRGTYFQRFTAFGDQRLNQLEEVLRTWEQARSSGRGHRRSALQLAVLDPNVDLVHLPRLGFPCLHQVSIVPGADGCLTLAGYYATQTIFEKAYGNYLGLAHLGAFISHEFQMPLASITCITSVAILGQNSAVTKKDGRTALCRELQSIASAAS
jgi:hypothetical protein